MTREITLQSKLDLFRDLLGDGWQIGDLRYGIPDCKVMINLNCSPQSWTRYRPQIIQYCKCEDLIKTELRDGTTIETINIRMQYDKKEKQWYGRRNQLNLIDNKNHNNYRFITPEELENYGIRWYHDEKFLY
jgi:hypothetical protein